MNGPILETRARPMVVAVLANQALHRGRLIGRRRRTAMVGIVDARGVVRVVHARYVSPWWEP